MFLFYLLTTIVAQHALALRCKCTTSKGVSKCNGDFCDVHGTSDKRAACGAVRVARQTHFACVHIKHTSNDTFCHVIKSATACWCRVVDFCNVDLEAELFDVDADEDERQQQRSEEDYFEEEISHDTFIITATRLDDMKSVELETVTRLSANDHLQLMPDTRTVAPSFLPDDYFDNYGEELDEEYVLYFIQFY
ncbi:unnamed protein product [Toxocara canis]|nr:unnamed protein product [Toxocara canis]